MDTPPKDHTLVDLSAACASASDVDDFLAEALPTILDLSGAGTALIVRRHGDHGIVTAQSGTGVDSADIDDDLYGTDARVLTEVGVPDSWSAAGVQRVAVLRLAGETEVLVLTFGGKSETSPWLDVALTMIEATTARLHAENRLSDLMLRVDSAQQLANMGDYDWHIATDTNRWSDQLYRIYGHEPQSFNASYDRFLSHIHPEDRERITGIHQSAYASGEPYEMIERIVRPDGQVRYLSSNGQVIRDAAGTPVRMRGTCVDITDRVLAEQATERIAARFRGLVESCPDAILVRTRAGDVVQANGRAYDLLGGDPVGHQFGELLPKASESHGGLALDATGVDGRELQVDVRTAALGEVDDDGLVAVFLRDAAPRLASEAVAATLRETQVRRRQALEINDNVVQGITAAMYALQTGDTPSSIAYLERTVSAARRMMNDWLDPLDGDDVQPGDLVRERASSLDEPARIDDLSIEDQPVEAIDPPRPDRIPPRILIVDDNDDVRSLMRTHVESMGPYDVVGEASDGQEAVEKAAELRPNVVLLDLAMPRMDGLQALPLILEAVPGVQVIVLSGFDQQMMADKVLAAGAARYVEKGIRMDLASVIEAVLTAA